MYCPNCGKQIPDDSRFCGFCGASIPAPEEDETTGNAEAKQNSQQNFFESGGSEGPSKNWKDYVTPANMELLASVSLLFPFCMQLVLKVLGFFTFLPFVFGTVFRILIPIVSVIFVIASIAGLAGAIYLLVTDKKRQTTWGWISLGFVAAGTLGVLGVMFHWHGLTWIFSFAATFYGIDLISRVVVQHMPFESVPNVGQDLRAYKTFYDNYQQNHPAEEQGQQVMEGTPVEPSYFDGAGIECFGYTLLISLISSVTCGIAAPWGICMMYKWKANHTVIRGRRLEFNGTGGQLFGHWIIWLLLTIVTCGIYSFFLHVALLKWITKHTYYQTGEPLTGEEPTSYFDGNSFEYFGYGLLTVLVSLLTLCIALPWMLNIIYKWEMKHTVICGDRLDYDGTGLGLFMCYIIIYLLNIVTCGIYSAWGTCRLWRYQYSHCNVAVHESVTVAESGEDKV